MKMLKRHPWSCALIVIALVLGSASLVWRWNKMRSQGRPDYLTAPAEFPLQLPANGQAGHLNSKDRNRSTYLLITQYLTVDKKFDLLFGDDPSVPGTNPGPLGYLSKIHQPPFYTVAIYLCTYPGGTHFLDKTAECAPSGTRAQTAPIGYASDALRPNHSILVRCHRKNAGPYLTHNARCDDIDDRYETGLGTVLQVLTSPLPAEGRGRR